MVADKFNELALRFLTFTFVQSVEDDQKGFWNSRRVLSHDELEWFDDEFSELNPPIFLEDGRIIGKTLGDDLFICRMFDGKLMRNGGNDTIWVIAVVESGEEARGTQPPSRLSLLSNCLCDSRFSDSRGA